MTYLALNSAIITRLSNNWTTTKIITDNVDYEPQGTVNISIANDISAVSSDNSYNSVSGQFSSIISGQFIKIAGFSTAGNNGYAKVVTATANKITVSGLTLTNEAIGVSKTITIDDLNIPFIYCSIDSFDSEAVSLGKPSVYSAMYRTYGNITISIFTPINEGIGLGLTYADTISSVFRGQNFNNVVCYSPTVLTGRQVAFSTGNWWQTPITCPFQYEEIF